MANSKKQTTGIVLGNVVVIAIMGLKFVGINTFVHF